MKVQIENTNYFITKEGKVFNSKNKELKLDSSTEYLRILLYYPDGTTRKQVVHRLVAKAFVPNPENKPIVNHIDGNKLNNHFSNLEWVTIKENAEHASRLGLLTYRGSNHHNSTYSEEVIENILKLLSEGYRNCDVCSELGLPKNIVSSVRNGASWKHLREKYNINTVRQKRASVETVEWVCSKLQDGFSVYEIVDMANSSAVVPSLIYDIKSRRTYRKISDKFNF